MQAKHKIFKGYQSKNETKNKKDYYDYDDEYKFYPQNQTKRTYSNEKSKKDLSKKRESSSREDDFDRYSYTTKISQRSMWGSKIFNSRPSKESIKQINTINNSKKDSDIFYSKMSNEKKKKKRAKKLKRILKCLIEFHKSRREVEGKYFDIWYDNTYTYYASKTSKDSKKYMSSSKYYEYARENQNNYQYNNYGYDDYKKSKKNKSKTKELNVPKKEIKEKPDSNSLKHYYTYSNIDDKEKDSDYYSYKENKYVSDDKEYNYYNEYNEYNKSKNKSKNSIEKLNSSSRLQKKSKTLKDEKYYNDSYNDEYHKEKLSLFNKSNLKKKEKKNKKFNKKLLYILNKYMIERKEKSQCFYKWIDFVTSIYLYNGVQAYNDFEGKSQQTKSYYEKSVTNNDYERYNKGNYNFSSGKKKLYNKESPYKVEKYYEDYEETPYKNDSIDNTENHTYIYNNQNNYSNKNILSADKREIIINEDNYDSYNNYDNSNNNIDKFNNNENNNYFYNYENEKIDKYITTKSRTIEDPNKIVTYSTYKLNNEPKVTNNRYYKYEKKIIEDPVETEDKFITTTINSNQLYKLKNLNSIDQHIIKDLKPNVIRDEDGYNVLEFTKNFPEQAVYSHKKETKIKVIDRYNSSEYRRKKNLNNNENLIKRDEYMKVEEYDSPLKDNHSLVTSKSKKK